MSACQRRYRTWHSSYILFTILCWYIESRGICAFSIVRDRRIPVGQSQSLLPQHFQRHDLHCTHRNDVRQIMMMSLYSNQQQSSLVAASDQALALWVFTFAVSHIGLSAVRTSIISSFGKAADRRYIKFSEQ